MNDVLLLESIILYITFLLSNLINKIKEMALNLIKYFLKCIETTLSKKIEK